MTYRTLWPNITVLSLTATIAFAGELQKSESVAKKKVHSSRIASMVEIQPMASISDQDASQVSFAAGRILKHVAQARNALSEKNTQESAAQIDQGLKLIAIVNSVLPHYKVKTEIKSGELAYLDEDEVRPRYVMLFDELEREDIFSPVAQAKRETHYRHRKHSAADAAIKEAPDAVAVSHVDIRHSTAKLDIVATRLLLSAAKRHLAEDKPGEADEALLALQSGAVLFEYEEIDLPLEEAADNLKLAEIEIKAGRTAEAKAALHVAIDQLKRYEKLVGDTRSAEVKALHQEITKLTNVLEKGPPTQEELQKMSAQIGEWWQNATKWFKNQAK